MPRPSLKAQRTEEILEAFARCVGKFGLEGSTLERIAEEAGVKRTILRHYVGNRDDLIDALTESIVDFYNRQSADLFALLPARGGSDLLVDYLFSGDGALSIEMMLAAEQLIAAGDRYPTVRRDMAAWVTTFVGQVSDVIARDHPDASEDDLLAVALRHRRDLFQHGFACAPEPAGRLPNGGQAGRQPAHPHTLATHWNKDASRCLKTGRNGSRVRFSQLS